MPDIVTHYYFGEQTLNRVPREISDIIRNKKNLKYYSIACSGPDPWFFCSFLQGKQADLVERATVIHNTKTAEFLNALAKEAWAGGENRDILFAYVCGYICHYVLDSSTHAYIVTATGQYNGTADTLKYRGNHMKLEHAIDSYIIRNAYHCVPWKYNISKNILKLRKFPEGLRFPINNAFEKTFGWNNVFDDLNRSIKDYYLFHRITFDPYGIIDMILRKIDNGISKHDLCAFSYYKKELFERDVDYLNLLHKKWHNPYSTEDESTASFPELFEKALQKAGEIIPAVFEYVYHGKNLNMDLLTDDLSYNSGLRWLDERNKIPPYIECIF